MEDRNIFARCLINVTVYRSYLSAKQRPEFHVGATQSLGPVPPN